MCQQKTSSYESRQKLRSEELEAIAKAVDIISSQVSGLAEKHLPTLAQTSFAQLRSSTFVKRELVTFLLQQAKKINSRVLFQLAAKAEDDPFKKIKGMIQDLITRLMEEANEEAEHKGWCDTELATNEQTRKQKTAEIDDLTAQIDKLTADIAQLAQEITDLNEDLSALEKAMAEATETRNAEHAKNTETIRDAQDAQAASAQALSVLNEFYSKAASATAFNQEPRSDEQLRVHEDATDTWTTAYKGMQGEGGGVVGMLEVIQSDFARLEADTKEAEATAQDEYEKFMHASEIDRTAKTKDVEFKDEKKNTLSSAHATADADRQGAQKELDAALAYYERLKPSCVDSGVSYEDRVSRRKEEIESLQEALRILSGEDIAA